MDILVVLLVKTLPFGKEPLGTFLLAALDGNGQIDWDDEIRDTTSGFYEEKFLTTMDVVPFLFQLECMGVWKITCVETIFPHIEKKG